MDPLFQASHSSHTSTSMKSPDSEGTGVQKETSVKLKENRPVSDGILQDLSLLINDEWLAVGKFLKIPEKNLPKIHTDYGARQKEATYSMLLSWKEKMGKNATYDILVEALKKAGRGDLADLSTELIDSQEQLLIMEEILKRQQRLFDSHKRGMAEKPFLPSSESQDSMQQDLFLAIQENIRCQERLINSHKRELEMEEKILRPWHIYDLQDDLSFAMKKNIHCKERLIDFHKRRSKMANKPFLPSSELHDKLQESLFLSMEFLNCQERLIEKHESEIEKKPMFHFGLSEPEIIEFKKENQPSLPSKSPELEILEFKKENQPSLPSKSPDLGKHELTMEKKTFVPSESLDKLDHFIRCLKAKYTTWVKSLKNTPWMKYNKLNIEDLFVDVDLLWHPSQSTMSPSSWQPLFSFQDLFTHSKLRRAHYITVEGESGSGKTILLYRMAHSWCINESFTQDIKLFILLPWSCIYEHCSLYMSIKRLLPKNTFLTVEDVRNILTNTKSIVALDDSPPHVVNRILDTDPLELLMPLHKDMGDLLAAENLQLMCFTSVNTNSLHTQKISNMTVKLQKWHKKQQLSYLQKLLPKDDKTHELILKRLGENSTLVNASGNPLFYVLFVHLLKDDLVYGKDVTIKNLWQLLKSTFENLNKNAITKPVQKEEESEKMSYLYRSTFLQNLEKYTIPKPMEDEKETERISYPQSISEAAYECFRKNEWQIYYLGDKRDYQTLEDLGILVEDQKDYFNRLSTDDMMSGFCMTHDILVRFRFCHKIFHLWFAVLYLSECSNIREEYERLFSPKHSLHWPTPQSSADKALLQRFICGLNSKCSVILLEDLTRGRYADNNDEDEHFFLCLNEYCGDEDSLRGVVNAICQRKREFTLGCSNQLVLKSMTRLLNLASQWKIAIDCINLTNHDIGDVDEEGLTLNNSVRLRPLSAKLIRINKWCGKQLSNYLNKCVHLVETRIFANDPRERRHEIQREVKEMNFKVRWESNYTYESNVRETKEDEIINLAVLFENLDVDSDDATASKRSENIQETLHTNDFEDSTNNLTESLKFNFEQIQDSSSAVLNAILCTEMYVDARGGTLVIEEAGISLEIPPGALNEGVTISIAVVNDAGVIFPHDLPMVSPIVHCTPSGQTFQKPVSLVLPHCGILNGNNCCEVISLKSYFSGGRRQWSIFTDTETVLSRKECSLKLINFCFRTCSIRGLESKVMRAFILKKRTEGALSLKLWICNDNPLVFDNILNMERNDGYQQMGAHQGFVIYKTLGNIESKFKENEMKIPLAHIWHGSGRFAVFHISFDSGDIGETLVAKQLGEEDDCSLRFFIDEKASCKRRKRKQNSTDSTIGQQPGALILGQTNSPGSSKTISIPEENSKPKDFNMNDVVSESSLWNLSGSLSQDWKNLGREVGFTEDDLQNIKKDNQGEGRETIYNMLLLWKKRNGRKATYGHILENLRKVGRLDLVDFPTWVNAKASGSEVEMTR